VRSGDASATEYFELGAVMLRRKFYPAAIKYLQQAIDKWDRDEQDLAQVSYAQLFGNIFFILESSQLLCFSLVELIDISCRITLLWHLRTNAL
jgi:hypothetical protein